MSTSIAIITICWIIQNIHILYKYFELETKHSDENKKIQPVIDRLLQDNFELNKKLGLFNNKNNINSAGDLEDIKDSSEGGQRH